MGKTMMFDDEESRQWALEQAMRGAELGENYTVTLERANQFLAFLKGRPKSAPKKAVGRKRK